MVVAQAAPAGLATGGAAVRGSSQSVPNSAGGAASAATAGDPVMMVSTATAAAKIFTPPSDRRHRPVSTNSAARIALGIAGRRLPDHGGEVADEMRLVG